MVGIDVVAGDVLVDLLFEFGPGLEDVDRANQICRDQVPEAHPKVGFLGVDRLADRLFGGSFWKGSWGDRLQPGERARWGWHGRGTRSGLGDGAACWGNTGARVSLLAGVLPEATATAADRREDQKETEA